MMVEGGRTGPFLQNKFLRGAAVGIAIFGATLLLWRAKAFEPLEWKSWDARLRLFSQPSRADKDIVLLAVDQESLDFYEKQQNLPWPWPRQIYSAVLDFLKAGGAKAVFIDILTTETSGFGIDDDRNLASAITRSGNVFLPLFLSKEIREADAGRLDALKRFALAGRAIPPRAVRPIKSVTLPVDVLMDGVRGLGNVEFVPDGDSVYRRLPIVFRLGEITLPSLPLAIAESIKGPIDLARVPFDADGRMILRFHGPAGTYKTYSIAAVINSQARIEEGKAPQILPTEFAGKTVIIGTTAPGLFDLRPTPFGGVYAGMEVLATAIDNLVHQDFVRPASVPATAAWILGLSLIAGLGTTILKKIRHLGAFLFALIVLPVAGSSLALSSGRWLEFAAPFFACLSGFLVASLLNYSIEGRQRRFIKSVFRFYLSPEVIERVLSNPDLLRLGGERREITAFFSDLAGFTSISEKMSPEELVGLLNAFLTEMTDIILDSGGTLDKYEGDAIIAFWNAPLDQPDHALRAARAALACQKRLSELREEFKRRSGHEIRMRVGLNSGPAVVGNMGSERRFDYTAMGDTMNLASRLEGVCKQYGVFTLVSEEAEARIREAIVTREVDMIKVVGKSTPVRVFELVGEKDEVGADELARLRRFGDALAEYRTRRFTEALGLFEALEPDPVAGTYAGRCRAFVASPPPEAWDGVYDVREK